MWIKRVGWLLALVLVFVAGQTAALSVDRPFFFAIKKNHRTSYILGSHHYGVAFNDFPFALQLKFLISDVFVSENGRIAATMIALYNNRATLSTSLEDNLSPPAWHELTLRMPQLSIQQLNSMTPSLVCTILDRPKKQEGGAVDMTDEFRARAIELGKRVKVLDYPTVSLDVFEHLCSLQDLESQLDKSEAQLAQERKTDLDYYLSGDLSYQQHLLDQMPADLREAIVTERNLYWRWEVERFHNQAQQSAFFVVDAIHLPGEQGLLSLLKKIGFSVSRIDDPDSTAR